MILALIPFRATSKRTRIETPDMGILSTSDPYFQSNIQENKDWNASSASSMISFARTFRATSKRTRIETVEPAVGLLDAGRLSEQHPREQGLKLDQVGQSWPAFPPFQSNIQENKDWNHEMRSWSHRKLQLSEQHPREQGLKLFRVSCSISPWYSFQSNIQENKDWNATIFTTSKFEPLCFQSNIQENKDWNI